jgi:hypothetical protein
VNRHGRQTRLAEVGAAGQARIASSTIDVEIGGLAGEVATRYLAGAGVGRLRVSDPSLAAVAASIDPAVRVTLLEISPGSAPNRDAADEGDDLGFRDPGARDLARGAREALRALRGALGCEP